MKFYLSLIAVFGICHMAFAGNYNITCYYDTASIQRGGFANFTENDLTTSFQYCTHVVYGYVGLKPKTFEIKALLAKQHLLFAQVKKLKKQNRHIKFLVSLGGDKDLDHPEKYIKLLEAPERQQDNFIQSVKAFLQKYKFDGLDLAYQFPHNKTRHSILNTILDKTKKIFSDNKLTGKFVNAEKSKTIVENHKNMHKNQFTGLVKKLKNVLRRERLMLTLTVLPQVNTTKFINIPAVMKDFDYVNLGTFDYATPEATHHDADYLAPINAPHRRGKHLAHGSIEQDVRQWLSHRVPSKQLNIGIPTYGRAWRMSKQLKSTVMPIKSALDGPAPGGELIRTSGLLSWPEMCFKLPKMSKTKDKTYGNYAYRSSDVKGQDGLFLTYEDSASLGAKAEYVERNRLGGIALFDLTLDDFRGKCKEGKYPALKSITFKLH